MAVTQSFIVHVVFRCIPLKYCVESWSDVPILLGLFYVHVKCEEILNIMCQWINETLFLAIDLGIQQYMRNYLE